jgi:hypothetical protein
MNTLDSIRATFDSSTVPSDAKVAMLGYSGGALATEWAAELAPALCARRQRAHDRRGDGRCTGRPAHNLHYVEGTGFWAGVMPMALAGIARAFEIDFTPYLTPYGANVFHEMQAASIINVLGRYPGLRWQDLVGPEYPTPEKSYSSGQAPTCSKCSATRPVPGRLPRNWASR